MTEHNLFYYPYASFTNAQLPLLKVAALYFDKLYLLDPVCASWDTIGADYATREAVKQLQDATGHWHSSSVAPRRSRVSSKPWPNGRERVSSKPINSTLFR